MDQQNTQTPVQLSSNGSQLFPHKSNNSQLIFLAIILVLSLIIAAYVFRKNDSDVFSQIFPNLPTVPDPPLGFFPISENKEEIKVEIPMTRYEDGGVYTNYQFGFELTFPATWKEYYVQRHDAKRSSYPSGTYYDDLYNHEKGMVQFSFKIKDGEDYYRVFSITAYPKAYWSEIYEDNGVLGGTYLGEQNGFVFAKEYPQEPPQTLEDFYQIQKDTEQILSTFRFTDTSNWKTYTDDRYGFQISYPQQWTVEKYGDSIGINSPERQKSLDRYREMEYEGDGIPYDMTISIIEWPGSLDSVDLFEKRKIIFASLPAYESYNEGLGSYYVVTTKYKNKLYYIFIGDGARLPATESWIKTLNYIQTQILSTFKFLN